MSVNCSALWPGDSLTDQLLHWSFIAGKLGATPSLSRPFLLGIRGAAPNDQETHQTVHRPRYDDTFVLLTRSAPPLVFAGATHAYQLDSKLSPDVSGDGRGDVGSIRPGKYLLTDTRSMPHPIFHLTLADGKTGRIPAYRDTDHDGVISQAEELASERRKRGAQVGPDGDYATDVLLHTGFDAPANAKHRFSIACQTCSLTWLELLRREAKSSKGLVDYVLANAETLLPFAEERRKQATAADNVA
jgi:hypothetical protein